MKQKSMSIYDFKKGDLITRILPVKSIEVFSGEIHKDRRYIGKPFIFLGIANGCVYIEKEKKSKPPKFEGIPEMGNELMDMIKMFGINEGPINLPLDIWGEGWSYYIDPYSIDSYSFGSNNKKAKESITIKSLESQLKLALKYEKYEEADKLKLRISKIKNQI